MFDLLSESEIDVLNLLTKREMGESFVGGWIFWKNDDLTCAICQKKLDTHFKIVHQHGRDHVQESKLFSFL